MKTLTEIRNEKPQYFVCINGANIYESTSLAQCKDVLCKFLKHNKNIDNTFDCYIGMYSITIE